MSFIIDKLQSLPTGSSIELTSSSINLMIINFWLAAADAKKNWVRIHNHADLQNLERLRSLIYM